MPNVVYPVNIILNDATLNKAIVQVFHPQSQRMEKLMKDFFKEGKGLLETMNEICVCKKYSEEDKKDDNDKGTSEHVYLGLWFDKFNKHLTTTSDQQQNHRVYGLEKE